jgi:hypothetical protein
MSAIGDRGAANAVANAARPEGEAIMPMATTRAGRRRRVRVGS